MTQVYTAQGILVPVTVIQAGPCTVVATRQPERDGYAAAQLGFGSAKTGRLSKPVQGQFKKAGTGAFAVLREFALSGEAPQAGTIVTVQAFTAGEQVKVTGISNGRGFQGVVHRHGFHGVPGTHGNTRRRKTEKERKKRRLTRGAEPQEGRGGKAEARPA